MSHRHFPLVDGGEQIDCKLKITRIKLITIKMMDWGVGRGFFDYFQCP